MSKDLLAGLGSHIKLIVKNGAQRVDMKVPPSPFGSAFQQRHCSVMLTD
jgi:hypothetical protein